MKNLIRVCALLLSVSTFAFEEALTFKELGVESIFKASPSDDPDNYKVDAGDYEVKASPLHWVVPGPASDGENVFAQKSNNQMAIEFFENRLFMAFRTSPRNYESKKTRMYIVSTGDGVHWELEWKSAGGSDTTEPQLLSHKGELHFYFYNDKSGETLLTKRSKAQDWSTPMAIFSKGEIPWEMKVRRGLIWMTSYTGHQGLSRGPARIKLQLKNSRDGMNFLIENVAKENVHLGGVTETGFEFDDEGNLYAVTRNDDGDESGFGAHLVFAPSHLLSYWSMLSLPQSYQSPRMFRHGKEIYLLARRHKGARPYNWTRRGGYTWKRFMNWVRFAVTPKTTALFKLGQDKRMLEHVMDLPGAGDTAFPTVRRVDAHTYLIANYTSALNLRNRRWIVGRLGRTQIYMMSLKFQKK